MKKWVLWTLIVVVGLFVACTGLVVVGLIVGEDTTATSAPAAPRQHKLVEEFGCDWLMDTYRPMAVIGRDAAIQHVANSIDLSRGGFSSFTPAGDAASAIRECEAQGYR